MLKQTILPHAFFDRSPSLVAPELLGKVLVRKLGDQILSGRIIETEAYLAFEDEASHGFIGKTKRNAALFSAAGHAYVYRIHQQYCLNAVTEDENSPSAVLIRGLQPLEGIELMQQFRKRDKLQDLTSGPGKLTQALQIDLSFNGIDLTAPEKNLYIYDDGFNVTQIEESPRIGISKAKDRLLRFCSY